MKNKTTLDCDFRDFIKIALELKDEDFTKIYFILKGMSISQENQQYQKNRINDYKNNH